MHGRAATIAVALAGFVGACRRAPVTAPDGDGPRGAPAVVAAAPAPSPPPAARPRKFHRIDVHTHIGPDGIPRALRLMDEWGIDGVVNLSGMYPGPKHMLDIQLAAAAEASGRVLVFTMPNFKLVMTDPQYGKTMAAM